MGQKTGRIYPLRTTDEAGGGRDTGLQVGGALCCHMDFSRKFPLFNNFRSSGTFMKMAKEHYLNKFG